MSIGWESGQASRIHNHGGPASWMAVPIGRLVVQNYEVVAIDGKTGHCELREANRLLMDPAHPAHVEEERPIHAVLNLAEYGGRATSLHVYSKPYDRCLVYHSRTSVTGGAAVLRHRVRRARARPRELARRPPCQPQRTPNGARARCRRASPGSALHRSYGESLSIIQHPDGRSGSLGAAAFAPAS